MEESVESCLLDALNSFSKVLLISKEPDLDIVFPVVNLWFANENHPDVNHILANVIIPSVASYKFVPLTYQIFSRLGSTVNVGGGIGGNGRVIGGDGSGGGSASGGPPQSFQTVLKRLVLKLCGDHPHHTLPQVNYPPPSLSYPLPLIPPPSHTPPSHKIPSHNTLSYYMRS